MITRRKLIAGGISAMILASLGGLYLRQLYEQTAQDGRRELSRWFELSSTELASGDVVLYFVDENDEPLNFTAFMIWEPTGEVEEVFIRNGRLVVPRRKIQEAIDTWSDRHRSTGTPRQVENSLFIIAPVSLHTESLPYTTVIDRPRIENRRYVLKNAPRRRDEGKRFSRCPEGRVVYVSTANLREYVPAVATFDRSSRGFIEYVDFSYHVMGSALRLQAFGTTSLGYGTDFRIWSGPTWSTGDLQSQGGAGRIPRGLDESAAVLFYNTVWRYIVYEVYDINACMRIDERTDVYLMDVEFEYDRIALRTTDRPPSVLTEPTEVSETRSYRGVDGKHGNFNMLRYVDLMFHEPLVDLQIRLGGAWPVGRLLGLLNLPRNENVRNLHTAFSFSVYSGIANYVSTINTDANAGVDYRLEIRRARVPHRYKDYVFRPLTTVATLVD